jgi:hypothetical protein
MEPSRTISDATSRTAGIISRHLEPNERAASDGQMLSPPGSINSIRRISSRMSLLLASWFSIHRVFIADHLLSESRTSWFCIALDYSMHTRFIILNSRRKPKQRAASKLPITTRNVSEGPFELPPAYPLGWENAACRSALPSNKSIAVRELPFDNVPVVHLKQMKQLANWQAQQYLSNRSVGNSAQERWLVFSHVG